MKEKGTLENPYTYGDVANVFGYCTFTSKDEPIYMKLVRKMEPDEIVDMIRKHNKKFEKGSIYQIEEKNDEYTRIGVVMQIDYKDFPTSPLGQTTHAIPIFRLTHDEYDFSIPIKYVVSENICYVDDSVYQGNVIDYAILFRFPKERDDSNIVIDIPRVPGKMEDIQYFKI